MNLEKSVELLSLGNAPPLPGGAPPLPESTPPVLDTQSQDVDESLIKQQLLSASTLNNVDLINQVIESVSLAKFAEIFNSTVDFTGNSPIHLCCKNGNYELLDLFLDQEGIEVDPLNKDGEPPLFAAVRYSRDEPEHGQFIVETLIDAGCDVTIQDKDGLKAVDLVPKDNVELISVLQAAEIPDDEEYLIEVVQDEEGLEGESDSESE